MLFPTPSLWLGAVLAGLGAALAESNSKDDVRSIPLRTHSFDAPYLDSDMQSRWFDFGGDTIIRTDRYVRLTSARQSQSGWIFSRVPLTATNWEIEVEFQISGEGGLYGDGFAMWITKQRAQQGPVFGFIDKFEGLGIFFDTYKNNRPGTTFPYVMAMLGDGNTAYDKYSDGKANELAGCSARGIRNVGWPTKAKLTYFQDENLVLELSYRDEDEWTRCFEIPNIKIPSVAYLGFSAETGELTDNHDIISVETKNLYKRDKQGNTGRKAKELYGKKTKNITSNSEGGSWTWFFFKVILFFLAIAGAYGGFVFYRTSQRRSKF